MEKSWRKTAPWEPANEKERANAPFNCKDKSCNKIDDDGNGYIDDFSGWNWAVRRTSNNQKFGDNDATDRNGHGTHCAGIVGAGHNGFGIAGVNNLVKLIPLKFLDSKGRGSLEGAVESVAYAISMGADVINASWGGAGDSRALGEIIKQASDKGILFVAAAGNSSENNDSLSRFHQIISTME